LAAAGTGNNPPLIAIRNGHQTHVALFDPFAVDIDEVTGGGAVVKSPMHGKLLAVFVAAGETVTKGQRLAIVEAMKMEHVLVAARDGVVSEIAAVAGQQVSQGARLVVIGEAA
jgi:3-methylcrotonyl-CoA carboxylase alpha subunit